MSIPDKFKENSSYSWHEAKGGMLLKVIQALLNGASVFFFLTIS